MNEDNGGKINFYKAENMELVLGKKILHSFPNHIHEKYCIGLILSGKVNFYIKDKFYELVEGDIYLINPSEPHSLTSANNSVISYRVVCFTSFPKNNRVFNKHIIRNKKLRNEIDMFIDNTIKDKSIDCDRFYNIILKETFDIIEIRNNEEEDERIRIAREYIRANIESKIPLDDIARKANISKYYFLRIFKEKLGMSPHKFHTQQKLRLAKGMIVKEISLVNIGCELGFVDQSHFINTFKKYTGVTPKEYRNSYKDLV